MVAVVNQLFWNVEKGIFIVCYGPTTKLYLKGFAIGTKWKNFKHKMIYYYFSEDTESLQLKQKFDSNSIEEQSKWGNSEV